MPGPDTKLRIDVYNRYGWRKRAGERQYAEKRVKVVMWRRYEERFVDLVDR